MSLRKGIGFCQQSEPSLNKDLAFNFISKKKDPAASYLRRGKPNYCRRESA